MDASLDPGLKLELDRLKKDGFVRARVDGSVVDLGDEIILDRTRLHDLDVVVDRLVLKEGLKGRLTDSVELALKLGEGRLLVAVDGEEPFWLSERFACIDCGISLPPIEPRMFSFNGPHGACATCDGLGSRVVVDPARAIGDPERTLREGVVLAWGRRGSVALATELARAVIGDVPLTAGKIRVDGRALQLRSPRDAVRAGLCLAPEERKAQALKDADIGFRIAFNG